MRSDIIFNKDFKANSIYVMTLFAADAVKVWNCFTQATLLDQWWAPEPWECRTVSQDFKEGGMWLYSMIGPAGEKQVAQMKYGEITEHRSFDVTTALCDETGKPDEDLKAKWLFGFTGVEEGTKVTINIHFRSEEEMNKILEMGFEQGFTTGLKQLEEIIADK
ncbi:SRPBCC domain-containing protein [Chryseobacterium sp. SSA4.19]|uniref:SRPBCC family protein n=1 Tax=Chryseobacterium sp. SSA4.19 TaxID=2919915 RepID=UPI001F4D44FF|nr:SRPBCC domain-containing protein [Chryseobacterium sp. SSA4.19]MCJ8152593.1 SRPBCC domain-containing protein [Chryseobacterium sp. SSA4.19]